VECYDAAGNYSSGHSITVNYAPPDSIAPVVTGFTIPATSTSLTVPISTFSCTDAVGVVGYAVTESATPPSLGDGSWRATNTWTSTGYIFVTQGAKTLFAWCKDAANNISNSVSDAVTITLPGGAPGIITGIRLTDIVVH
jgi:hypothetical protein